MAKDTMMEKMAGMLRMFRQGCRKEAPAQRPLSDEQAAKELLASCTPGVREALDRIVWHSHVCRDVQDRADDTGYGEIPEAQVRYAADYYIAHHDHNEPYNQDIDYAIDRAIMAMQG